MSKLATQWKKKPTSAFPSNNRANQLFSTIDDLTRVTKNYINSLE
jgi:hypothetical protein